jgi:enoyl-CoA hydratase/carnithine racemase
MSRGFSILDDVAVDPHAAEAALVRLSERVREGLAVAGCALLGGLAATLLGHLALLLPALAGAVAGIYVALTARGDRTALVARLVGQRSAYAIPAVADAARHLSCVERRRRMSRSLSRLVLEAAELEPRGMYASPLPARVLAHGDDLLAVAFLLAQERVKVHPASIALLDRLLSSPMRSPLFNPYVPEQHLRLALQRVRAAITV